MKIIPFDIEKAKSGKYKIQTKDGKPVRIICWDKKDSTYNLAALITFKDGNENMASFTKTGACCTYLPSPLDLVLVDESTPNIRQQIYDIIIKAQKEYPSLKCATQLSTVVLADFIQEGLNLPKWKFIKEGEKLPETSLVMDKEGMLYGLQVEKGTQLVNDFWYLPIKELENLDYEI